LDGTTQIIARGPVASQEAIKLLSGHCGGFFNANSAHPFENPTALINLCEMPTRSVSAGETTTRRSRARRIRSIRLVSEATVKALFESIMQTPSNETHQIIVANTGLASVWNKPRVPAAIACVRIGRQREYLGS
jgi:K+-transporting ATPase A subunit